MRDSRNWLANGCISTASRPPTIRVGKSVIATGDLPHIDMLREGNDRAVLAWDILSGGAQPGQSVVNYGTRPLDDLYFDIKPLSSNLGQVDYDALMTRRPHDLAPSPAGEFQLFRIGNAVSSRNTHAAIYDTSRLLKSV